MIYLQLMVALFIFAENTQKNELKFGEFYLGEYFFMKMNKKN